MLIGKELYSILLYFTVLALLPRYFEYKLNLRPPQNSDLIKNTGPISKLFLYRNRLAKAMGVGLCFLGPVISKSSSGMVLIVGVITLLLGITIYTAAAMWSFWAVLPARKRGSKRP